MTELHTSRSTCYFKMGSENSSHRLRETQAAEVMNIYCPFRRWGIDTDAIYLSTHLVSHLKSRRLVAQ